MAGLMQRVTNRKPWERKEDAQLSELYKTLPITAIARIMDRSTGSIYNRVQKLSLKRTDEYKSISGQGQFKPGNKSWNTGLKGWQAGGRANETKFKPGQTSSTWRPIGSERTSKDGTLYRKVSDTRNKNQDWRPVAVITWEEHNGPLPDGMIVVHKDRNRRNFDPSNLEAITRADNMRRNTIDRYPEEYRKMAITLGWFKRKLKKLEEENEVSE